jgi:hypothetical protein
MLYLFFSFFLSFFDCLFCSYPEFAFFNFVQKCLKTGMEKLTDSTVCNSEYTYYVIVIFISHSRIKTPWQLCLSLLRNPRWLFSDLLLSRSWIHIKIFLLGQDGKTSPKHKSIVYPFDRNSEQSFQRITDLEREQFSSLNIHSSFESDSLSPRVRSFPTTPEKGARPISPLSLTLGSPYFGKSRSLNSLTSSRTDMRFSRHMVSGSDCGDMEV